MQHAADSNQGEIVEGLEASGCVVAITSQSQVLGFPDLVVSRNGVTKLMEVKPEGGKLRKSQEVFHAKWKDSIPVVHTADEAIAAMNAAIRKRG